MNARQYTLRNVSPVIDKKLRRLARSSDRSLNDVTLEALRIGLGISPHELADSGNSLHGLAAFDRAAKLPSKLDPNKSVKELYRESITKKHPD